MAVCLWTTRGHGPSHLQRPYPALSPAFVLLRIVETGKEFRTGFHSWNEGEAALGSQRRVQVGSAMASPS